MLLQNRVCCNHKLQSWVVHHHHESSGPCCPEQGTNTCLQKARLWVFRAFWSCSIAGRAPQLWTCKLILWSPNPASGFFMITNCREFPRVWCSLYNMSATHWVSVPAAWTISRAVFLEPSATEVFKPWGFLSSSSSLSIMGQLPYAPGSAGKSLLSTSPFRSSDPRAL